MKVHDRRVGLLVLAISVALVFTGASWPLNPLVTRTERPRGPVPAECDEALAPAPAPRVDVTQIPAAETVLPAVVPAAPPSRTLRSELESAHAALASNDRPAFDAHLANAREIVRDYPAGGERNAAEDALRAFDDAARIWDAQFQSPFFDQSSDAYARASRYPGYEEAVRRGVFTDDAERRFYPAAESRDFVARAAAERLGRLGIRTPTMRARSERTVTPSAPPASVARADDTPPAPRRTTRARTTTSPRTTTSRATTRTTTSAPRTTATRRRATSTIARSSKSAAPAISAPSTPDPSTPARTTADPAPAAPTAAAPTPAPTASPAAAGAPTTDTVAPSDTGAAADTAEPTDTGTPTTTTVAQDTAPTPADTATAPAERRSVIVPALLILIGLGVLIVLFRASK